MRSNGTARATDAREDVERYVGARIVGILDSLEVVAELKREYPITCEGCGNKIGVGSLTLAPEVRERMMDDLTRRLGEKQAEMTAEDGGPK